MRRRTPRNLLIAAAALVAAVLGAPVVAPAAPASAAHRDTPTGTPTVEVFAPGGGIVPDGGDLVVSVVVVNPSTDLVAAGHVSVSVTSAALGTAAKLTAFDQHPKQSASRSLGTADTTSVPAGGTQLVAQLTVPAATLKLPATSPGVFGLTATVTTSDGTLGTGTGTLVVPGATPSSVEVAAVMPITAPASADGLISSQDLATYTAPDGVLDRELTVAQRNPSLTIGIDPMILTSIRVLGQSAPASAQSWLRALSDVSKTNPSFALQYGDADPGLQVQAGLAAPLQPSDFTYAMSPGDVSTPPTVGEPTDIAETPTPSPTPSPTSGPQLLTLSQLTGFTYSLGGIAWPASATVRAADLTAFGKAGLPTTIVSSANTNASSLSSPPDAALKVGDAEALVIDDTLSSALQAAANAPNATEGAVANATLNAQLALAAENSPQGTVLLASLGRTWPADASRAASAVTTVIDSTFTRTGTIDDAIASTPTSGLALVDKQNESSRIESARALLDVAGEPRSGGSAPPDNIASFASVLSTPVLLTGEVRARLLDLFSVGWVGSNDWDAAVTKQLSSMHDTLTAVQIVSPGSIRQASRQALIPITVTNKLSHPVDVVLRATPSSARLEVDSDTEKTIAAGSSAKVLVPVKSQLSNGTVHLGLQLYSSTGVSIGASQTAEIDVHADWEGIGALIFGIIVAGFFGFGLFRTIQRRRREKAEGRPRGDADDASADAPADPAAGGADRG